MFPLRRFYSVLVDGVQKCLKGWYSDEMCFPPQDDCEGGRTHIELGDIKLYYHGAPSLYFSLSERGGGGGDASFYPVEVHTDIYRSGIKGNVR